MNRTLISDLQNNIGNEVRVRGKVSTVRDQGKIVFLIVTDRTSSVQCVAWIGNSEELLEKSKTITEESIVDITGLVKETNQVKEGFEIEIRDIQIDSLAEPTPIVIEEEYATNTTSLDQRLDYRWIDLRSERNKLIFQINSFVLDKMRSFLLEKSFTEIFTPKIISAASEGGADVFEVNYFDKKAYLAQSPQFHKQMAMAAGLERIFSVGPAFRAEKSFTTRHLTEYTSFDVEMAYIDSYKEICSLEEAMIKFVLKSVKETFGDDIVRVFDCSVDIDESEFPTISMVDVKKKLAEKGVPSKGEGDVSPEEERAICEIMKEETGSDFLFIVDYPHSQRAFYHMKNEDDPSLALGYDLYWKGVEITTGAQREHRLENLIKNAEEKGINPESLNEYIEYFKYGCPPHGGFAIGTERFLMKLLNLSTVLEATYLPNTPNRLGRLIAKN